MANISNYRNDILKTEKQFNPDIFPNIISTNITTNDATINNNITVNNDAIINNDLTVNNNATIENDLTVKGDLFLENLTQNSTQNVLFYDTTNKKVTYDNLSLTKRGLFSYITTASQQILNVESPISINTISTYYSNGWTVNPVTGKFVCNSTGQYLFRVECAISSQIPCHVGLSLYENGVLQLNKTIYKYINTGSLINIDYLVGTFYDLPVSGNEIEFKVFSTLSSPPWPELKITNLSSPISQTVPSFKLIITEV
jgi:hypothetical protein